MHNALHSGFNVSRKIEIHRWQLLRQNYFSDKSKKILQKWGAGLGLPLVLEDNKPPGCLLLEDLQTLHIPINKKREVWTQYRLLRSFLGGYFSSFKKILKQSRICKKKITGLIFHGMFDTIIHFTPSKFHLKAVIVYLFSRLPTCMFCVSAFSFTINISLLHMVHVILQALLIIN